MSNHFPKDHALGLLALELAGGDTPQHAALDTTAAGNLAALVGRDLAKLVPQAPELDFVFAAAHFDPAEVLRPGWAVHRRFADL